MKKDTNGKEWWKNPKAVENMISRLNISGIPLEIKSKQKLNEIGLSARKKIIYDTETETYLEKDLFVEKEIKVTNESTDILVVLRLLGECKNSLDAFFAFEWINRPEEKGLARYNYSLFNTFSKKQSRRTSFSSISIQR